MRLLSRTPSVVVTFGHTLNLGDACKALGISRRTAARMLAAGTFPVPELPRVQRGRYRFSAIHVDRYLARLSPVRRSA
jgi:excisionase family DNA binding protein